LAACGTLFLNSPSVSITNMKPQWGSLTDQQNTQNNVSTLQQQLVAESQNQDTQVVFSHVPKTAGTSLENILAKNFRFADVLHINAPDLNQCPQLLELKRSPFKLICGHHPIHGQLYGLLPAIKTFHLTMLRNPVDRVLSYYNYIQGKADHPMHEHAVGISLEQFIENNPSPELHNGQVRRFSGYLHQAPIDETVMLEKAMDTLDKAFSLVLTTCHFDESLLLLQQRLGLKDIFYQRHNVSTPFLPRAELSTTQLECITAHNQADIQLFEFIKARCQQLIQAELSTSQIKQFQQRNRQWQTLLNQQSP